MERLIRNLEILRKADFLIARIWIDFLLRRFGLFAFAALIAAFGLGMVNVAGLYALQPTMAPVWAASVVAVLDLLVAGIVLLIAGRSRPGPELDRALEVHSMAGEALQTDAHELKLMIDALGQELREAKATLTQFVRNPLDLAAQKLLVPAALSIIRGLREKQENE